MTASTDRLFVYGSLLANQSAHAFLRGAGEAECLGRATVRGTLYSFGAWPGLVVDPDAHEEVHGELYRIDSIERLFERLDPYEDCPSPGGDSGLFRRILTTVEPESGPHCTAWVYVYAGDPAGGTRIPSGRWEGPKH